MTLQEMLKNYNGVAVISIEGYCEEVSYDYCLFFGEANKEDSVCFFGRCMEAEPWWDDVKDRKVKEWQIIGGGIYNAELAITLED